MRKGTRGTETSKYPQEKKSKEIPLVVASECGKGQTRVSLLSLGLRTCMIEDVFSRTEWKVRPEGVKVPYAKSTDKRQGSRVPRDTRNLVGSREDHLPSLKTNR